MPLSLQTAAFMKSFTAGAFEVKQDPPRNTLRKERFTANNIAPTHNFNTTPCCCKKFKKNERNQDKLQQNSLVIKGY